MVSSAESQERMLTGRAEPPAPARLLRAGPVTALLDGIDLRAIRVGSTELFQRVSAGVRDPGWNTLPAVVSDLVVTEDTAAQTFRVSFTARNAGSGIDFAWCGVITGDAAGRITYALDGTCHGEFDYARIGVNVLHGSTWAADRRFRASLGGGAEQSGRLPVEVAPQLIANGLPVPLLHAFDRLAIDLPGDVTAINEIEGSRFELEDQRNWTDGSFKSYAQPFEHPLLRSAHDGETIRQQVTLSFAASESAVGGAAPRASEWDPAGPATITIGAPVSYLPSIGVSLPFDGAPLAHREGLTLRALRPSHLRADVHLDRPDHLETLATAMATAEALDATLIPALHVSAATHDRIPAVAEAFISRGVPIELIIVLSSDAPVTRGEDAAAVREAFGDALVGVVVGGPSGHFAALNRERAEDPAIDGLVFPIVPSVHASDDASLVAALPGQADALTAAREIGEGRPAMVGPVALADLEGPWSTGPETEPGSGELPRPFDTRQASLFGAAWTVGSLRALSEAGTPSITYYETSGPRGLLAREDGEVPAGFPAVPGDLFPPYWVLSDVALWRSNLVLHTESSRPGEVEALAVRDTRNLRILVANLTRETRQVTIGPLPGTSAKTRILDETTAEVARTDAVRFRMAATSTAIRSREAQLTLRPYAVVRLEVSGVFAEESGNPTTFR